MSSLPAEVCVFSDWSAPSFQEYSWVESPNLLFFCFGPNNILTRPWVWLDYLTIQGPFQPGAFLLSRVTIIGGYKRRADNERYIALVWCSRDAGFIDSWFIQRSRSNCVVSADVIFGILRFWQRSCWRFKSCECRSMSNGKFYRRYVGIYSFTHFTKYSQAGRYASPPSPALTRVFLRALPSRTAWPWRWKHCCYSKRQGRNISDDESSVVVDFYSINLLASELFFF